MGYLLPFIDITSTCPPPEPPKPHLPLTHSINASSKTALLVEDDKSLSNFLKRCLKDDGYAVRTASSREEGLRLYRDCSPFNVVLIDYFVPQRNGATVDYLALQQTESMELALAIHNIDPSQGLIIVALDYQSPREVRRPMEVMHIPVLISPNVLHLRGLLEKIEVDRAIKALTPAELLRLEQFARFRIRGLGRAAAGREWEDLLSEALLRTLIGAEDSQSGRHWNKKVTFFQHLKWAVSSIADVWKRQFKETSTYRVSELLVQNAEGQEHSPLEHVASEHTTADQRLIEKDEENRVLAEFKDDAEATLILQGWMDGLKRNEIMSQYGLVREKYTAAVRRIRLKALAGKSNGRGGNRNGI